MVDPYVAFGKVQDTATAPFYDWLLGLIAWIAGFGSPSDSLLHSIAAWYPAVLAVCTVVAIFLLARLIFGWRAALVAAAVIATLPGHFLRVSSLGFTDHHIMESLLVTLFFFLLLRAIQNPPALKTSVAAGLTLAAYLLTFHGSAITVGIVVAWALFDRVRWFWPGEKPEPPFRPLYVAFLIALGVCLLFRHLLWMNYTIAALTLGIVGLAAVEWWARLCRRMRRPGLRFYGGLSAATLAALAILAALAQRSSLRHSAKIVITHLAPSLFGTSGGVYELQSLIYDIDHFSLLPAIRQFWGAYFLALIGLFLLAEYILRRRDRGAGSGVFLGTRHVCPRHGRAPDDLLLRDRSRPCIRLRRGSAIRARPHNCLGHRRVSGASGIRAQSLLRIRTRTCLPGYRRIGEKLCVGCAPLRPNRLEILAFSTPDIAGATSGRIIHTRPAPTA